MSTPNTGSTTEKRPPPTPLRVPPDLLLWYKRHAEGAGSNVHAEMIVALYEFAERNTNAPVPVRTPAMLARDDAAWSAEQLADLDWHWGEAYRISNPEEGVWLAQRRDTNDTFKATTPAGLHHSIVADYHARGIPRPGRRPQQ
jgi:hypothetical protein